MSNPRSVDGGVSPEDVVAVGRIGKPHGIRGEVYVEPWTDAVDERFVPGGVFPTDPAGHGPLTIETVRWQSGKLVLRFHGVADRNSVEAIRGTYLVMPARQRPPIEDPDEFYDSDLIGLAVHTVADEALGTVTDILHSVTDSLLVIDVGGREVLLPFRKEFVPVVEISAGLMRVAPPEGLLEL